MTFLLINNQVRAGQKQQTLFIIFRHMTYFLQLVYTRHDTRRSKLDKVSCRDVSGVDMVLLSQ